MAATVAQRTKVGDNLVEFLQEKARRFDTRTALLFKPGFRYQRWSYADLWEGSGKVASLLQQSGLSKGDRALLWGHNSPQWVVAFFGCLRAGVVVVPLDVRSAPEFAHKVASKASPSLAFVSRVTPAMHQELGLPEIRLEELETVSTDLPPPKEVEVSPEDLVEIMFTSGTTGDPKGVMLTHRNLLSNLESLSQCGLGKPNDRLLSLLPLSHMLEQMGGLLVALRAGANITYPTSRQPTVLSRTMRERKVSLLVAVPLFLDLFMKGIEREVRRSGKQRIFDLSMKVSLHLSTRFRRLLFRRVHQGFGGSLDMVFSGGAALDPELGAKWEMLGVKISQGYGTTEASPVISCHTADRPRYDSAGRPVPEVSLKISEDGEVLLRGPNITSGYWKAPEQTAASFEDGWYKTGDQGFLDPEGFVHLRGRKKDMIVLASGQNVYPEDVEAILNRHPDITDAIVVGLPRRSDTEVHAAFLLDEPEKAKNVVSWANGQLAEHQRIRGYTVWPDEDFPRTHTLKVKKGVVIDMLRGSESASPAALEASHKPGSGDLPELAALIAEVGGLSRGEVTPEKALGEDLNLDSLKRVELLSVVEGELGVYLDEGAIDGYTTVQMFEALVAKGSKSAHDMKFPTWGMNMWARTVRGAIQRAFIFPFLRLTYRLRVTGRENLRDLTGPVLYAANHHLPLDNGLIIKSFPSHVRRRLAIAGAQKLWDSRFWAIVNPLVGNGFPFSQEGAIRPSLDNLGRILDNGWSVLIYPEGKVTVGGPVQPFLNGTGLLAVEGGVSVVPVHLRINSLGSPWRAPFLRRGDIEVRFGRPLSFSAQTSYIEATEAIEEAVKSL